MAAGLSRSCKGSSGSTARCSLTSLLSGFKLLKYTFLNSRQYCQAVIERFRVVCVSFAAIDYMPFETAAVLTSPATDGSFNEGLDCFHLRDALMVEPEI